MKSCKGNEVCGLGKCEKSKTVPSEPSVRHPEWFRRSEVFAARQYTPNPSTRVYHSTALPKSATRNTGITFWNDGIAPLLPNRRKYTQARLFA